MNETSLAFENPSVRAAATAGDQPLDRISVRDHVRAVEIGAFQSERGKLQRLRFNVVLEVSRHTAAQNDDVDQVISYDTIIEAIEAQLTHERINLLETLAERVAQRCLADPRAVRVFVRIEKLDRIPGALGVEIVRRRLETEDVSRLHPVTEAPEQTAVSPRVLLLGAEVLADSACIQAWLDVVAAADTPVVLALPPLDPARAASDGPLEIGLLSIEQNAWAVAALGSDLSVAGSRTELDWAIREGRKTVWAPFKMVTDAVEKPGAGADDPVGLALWLAGQIGASDCLVAGAAPALPDGATLLDAARPGLPAGAATG
ncbi:FolB domain-containing protein [Rhodobacteraceae bacterium KN286]|uniref:dihydroneopterin aldolase n=1 Tax=Oceanomicrobium pacificus TaxID=2692916 RepID=A0A6B0TS20_9RHOB|nr:FolB domain-containing protein [Oceanomicrobium pacificus]